MNSLKTPSKKSLSVIVPCFNESEVIEETHNRLSNSLNNYLNDYEIIYVNDGSSDDTLSILKRICALSKKTSYISFSRNFGHQIAITAGIDEATKDAAIVIDADLQDPPEIIHEMYKLWINGADVVYGVRTKREGETWVKLLLAKYFYKFLRNITDIYIPVDTGDFRLIDRKVIEVFKSMPERHRYVRGMISWAGFVQVPVYYERKERYAGKTKYPFSKMLKFALDGIISFSTKPLKLALISGIFFSFLSLSGIVYSLYMRLFTDQWVPGWTLLFIAILLIGGIQLIILGIIGEYIGRIYGESKNRPLYIIMEKNNINN